MKQVTSVLLGLVAFSNTGFAFPAFDLLQSQIPARMAQRSLPAARSNVCANFSGSWKGKCSVDGASAEGAVEIKQDGCNAVQMGTQSHVIGAMENHSQTFLLSPDKTFSYGGSLTSDWNAEGSQLVTHFTGMAKLLGTSGHIPLSGKGVMKLDGSRLVNELSVLGMNISCVYEKQ